MIDLMPEVDRWRAAGHQVALARVVRTDGSSPLPTGSTMAVSGNGDVAGSVSGGCVESAVAEQALAVLRGERPAGVVRFGYSDAEAVAVGLTCGGTVEVYVEVFDW